MAAAFEFQKLLYLLETLTRMHLNYVRPFETEVYLIFFFRFAYLRTKSPLRQISNRPCVHQDDILDGFRKKEAQVNFRQFSFDTY